MADTSDWSGMKSAPAERRTPCSRAAAASARPDTPSGSLTQRTHPPRGALDARADREAVQDRPVREREAALQAHARPREVPVVVAADEEEVQRRLQDGRRRELAHALERREAVDELLRPRDPADAHAREERLADRPEVDDVLRRERGERRRELALDEEVGVERVLDEEDAGRGRAAARARARRGADARRPVGFWKSGIV